MISHDHNFKNMLLDFPKETLEWILPDIPAKMGEIRNVKFIRQEPGKRRLSDAHLSLDMPICLPLTRDKCYSGWWSFRKIKTDFRFTDYCDI